MLGDFERRGGCATMEAHVEKHLVQGAAQGGDRGWVVAHGGAIAGPVNSQMTAARSRPRAARLRRNGTVFPLFSVEKLRGMLGAADHKSVGADGVVATAFRRKRPVRTVRQYWADRTAIDPGMGLAQKRT